MVRDAKRAQDEEAKAEVVVLDSKVELNKALGKKLQASLDRLSIMGRNIDEAIGPIQSNTQELQILERNIEGILAAIDQVKKPSATRNIEEDVIRAGPDKVGLSEFLASMGRVTVALRELKATNMRSNQEAIADLNKIIKSGNTQLESLFRRLLQEDANPVEPLHFIIKQKPFPLLSQDKTVPLGLIIADHHSRARQPQEGDNVMAQVYAQERGPYVTLTLENLAAASINTARKKSPDAVYKRGTNGMGTYASGIEGLFLAEFDNICALFPREEWGKVLSLTCQGAVSELSKTLKELNTHIKDNITTDCFLGFEIIEIISNLSFKIHSRTGELKGDFAQAAKPIRETTKLSLAELLEDIRRRVGAIQVLPNDGNPLPVVTEVMTRLMSLLEYSTPVTSIMTSLGDGNWKSINSANMSNDTLDVGPDADKLFAHYCTDTVDTLLASTEQKGRSLLKGSNLMGTFLANNVCIADRMIRTSDLEPVFRSRPACIEPWKKKALSLYMDVWKGTANILLDTQPTARGARPPSGSSQAVDSAHFLKGLSSKEKDVIKDKFRNFNVAFDDNVTKHKSLSMEREVKELFGKQVRLLVEPLYIRFFDRYHEIDKGKGKYVKYSKAEMGQVLMSLE